jgi:hypothetical protein
MKLAHKFIKSKNEAVLLLAMQALRRGKEV